MASETKVSPQPELQGTLRGVFSTSYVERESGYNVPLSGKNRQVDGLVLSQ